MKLLYLRIQLSVKCCARSGISAYPDTKLSEEVGVEGGEGARASRESFDKYL